MLNMNKTILTPLHTAENWWFGRRQPLLLEMVRIREGRRLLGIDDLDLEVIGIRPHAITFQITETRKLTVFRTRPTHARRIRHFWDEFCELEKFIYKHRSRSLVETARAMLEDWKRRGKPLVEMPVIAGGAVTIVYPDPTPEIDTVDGFIRRAGVDEDLATIRVGAGTVGFTTQAASALELVASATLDQYQRLARLGMTFDTSIVAPDIVASVIYSLWFASESNGMGGDNDDNSRTHCVAFAPANDDDLEAADYGQVGDTSFGTTVQQVDMSIEYQNITLDANGIDQIVTDGISGFAARHGWDFNNSETGLTWGANQSQTISYAMAETGGIPDTINDPKLEMEHFPPESPSEPLPEYGQLRTAIGDPSVYGATIHRS